MQQYYKVVRMESGRLWSACARDELQCEYVPGQWATAPVGGLLVFRSEKDARRWVRECCAGAEYMIQVWLADCEDPVPLPRIALGYPWIKKIAEHVWSKGALPERIEGWVRYGPILDADWPAGTLAFRKVKLICKCEKEEACKS
jgi:hypothetical protein